MTGSEPCPIFTFYLPNKPTSLDVDASSSSLLVGESNGDIKCWRLDTKRPRFTATDSLATAHAGFCGSTSFSVDSKYFLLVPDGDDYLKAYDVNCLSRPVHTLRPDTKKGMLLCSKVVKHCNRTLVFAGFEDGSLVAWDLQKPGKCLLEHTFFDEPLMAFDYSPVVNLGFTGSSTDSLFVWNLDEDNSISVIQELNMPSAGISVISIRGDGKIVAVALWGGNIRILSVKTRKLLAVLTFHRETVQKMVFADCQVAGNGWLVSASNDRSVSIWDLYS